eukprot:m.73182 g.73182  ORF g.73182 m.73182 type:complete len:307 (-) comp24532_c0_seq1:460-1380(-)
MSVKGSSDQKMSTKPTKHDPKFPTHAKLQNNTWKSLDDCVVQLFKRQQNMDINIQTTNVGLRQILQGSATASLNSVVVPEGVPLVIAALTNNGSMLLRGAQSLQNNVKNFESVNTMRASICREWNHFHRRILPRLQAIFVPLTMMIKHISSFQDPAITSELAATKPTIPANFDIRDVSLMFFRDEFLLPILKLPRTDPFMGDQTPLPKNAVEMLLTLQRTADKNDIDDEGTQTIRRILVFHSIPHLSSRRTLKRSSTSSKGAPRRSPNLNSTRHPMSSISEQIPRASIKRSHRRSPSDVTRSFAQL